MENRKREADLEFERERDRLRLDRLEAAVEKMGAQLARLTGESE